MSLVTTKGMLLDAQKRNYAVGAFNANNLEMAQGIIKAAEAENAPVIIMVSQGGINYGGIKELASIVKTIAKNASVPAALHLDHSTNYYYNVLALRNGFTSLMFDGSQMEDKKNIEITKKVVTIAHVSGVPVEAEIGEVPKDPDKFGLDDLEQFMTEPEEAVDFVNKTGIDSLAVAVGSMHKMKIQEAQLDIDRIERIREKVDIPLVLHGSSGVTDESVRKSVEAGICKVNVHTHIAKNFTQRIRKVLNDNPDMADLRKYLSEGREALYEEVRKKMQIYNATDKADDIEEVKIEVDPEDME